MNDFNVMSQIGGPLLDDASKVIVFTTGGTIDKTYNEFDGSLKNNKSTIERCISSSLRLPYTDIQVFSLMSKDSLDMTQEDRLVIAEAIQEQLSSNIPIIIIHGTDSMCESANYCFSWIKEDITVPVIFTGAMSPLGLRNSDALQNIAESLLAAKLLSPGIYICFHNRVFPVPGTRKNRDLGTFESLVGDSSIKSNDQNKTGITPHYL